MTGKIGVRRKDISGQVFGRLTALTHFNKRNPSGRSQVFWNCDCECGANLDVLGECLRRGTTTSCGCYSKEATSKAKTIHGMSQSDEYKIYQGIKDRCLNPNEIAYPHYGGRGIKVSDDWLETFENFFRDMGPRPSKNHSIERKDPNGNYCQENCVWTDDNGLQAFNQRPRKSKFGIPGIRCDGEGYGYVVTIGKDGTRHYIGFFKDLKEAAQARKDAELKYYGFNLDWEMPE